MAKRTPGIKLQSQPKRVGFDRFNNRYLDEDFVNERISRNRRMADMLMGQNANTVVQSPTQGLAMLARALNARDYNKLAQSEQDALRDQYNQQMGALMSAMPPDQAAFIGSLPNNVRDAALGMYAKNMMTPAELETDIDQFSDAEGNVKVKAVVGSDEWKAAVNDPSLFVTTKVPQLQRSEVTSFEDPRTQSQRGRDVQTFNDAGQGAASAIDTTTDLAKIALSNPAALGMPGGFARFTNDWIQTGKQLVRFLDPSVGEFDVTPPDSFDYSKLRGTAIDNAQFRAGVYSVAFAAAVAKQGTRPTDKDIQAFIDQIAGSATDPMSFLSVAGDFNRRMVDDVKRSARIKEIPVRQQDIVFKELDDALSRFNEVAAPKQNIESQIAEIIKQDPTMTREEAAELIKLRSQ